MAIFAKVLDGLVSNIIVADDNSFLEYYVDDSAGDWIETCQYTYGNVHTEGGTPLRKNYAIIGGHYDASKEAFYAPQPYPSWILDSETYTWDAPVPYPSDGEPYDWDEETLSWILVTS
tara:strand:+ start:625 stop:978 length:354 start_codon:yes stop_codon:yes gene_type:complete